MRQRIFIEILMNYAVIALFTIIRQPRERNFLIGLPFAGREGIDCLAFQTLIDNVCSRPVIAIFTNYLHVKLYVLRGRINWLNTFTRAEF